MNDLDVVKKACIILQTIKPLGHSPAREIANRTFEKIRPSLSEDEVSAFALLVPDTERLGSDAEAIYNWVLEASFSDLVTMPEIGIERRMQIQYVVVMVCKEIIQELITELGSFV